MSSSPEIEVVQGLSAGQLLRQARLKAGVHLAVLSVHLKVPVRQLEALEADEWDAVKGPVFYRGLASSVCRQLNMESGPVLALLPRPSGQIVPTKSLQQSTEPRLGANEKVKLFRKVSSTKFVVVMVFLSGLAYAWFWMPSPPEWGGRDGFISSLWDRNPPQVVTQEIHSQSAAQENAGMRSPSDTQDSSPTAAASPSSALGVATSSQAPLSSGTGPMKFSSVDAALAPPSAQWVFSASGESSIELRNSKDIVIFSGVLKAGETQRIDSPLPVRVVIGHAQVVNASLRGQAFDLKPHTQVTVARFEVKE